MPIGIQPKADSVDNLDIRPLAPDAVAEVAVICAHAPDPWGPADIEAELCTPAGLSLVAYAGEAVVGFCSNSSAGGEASLYMLATHPSWRRQGVACALLAAAAKALTARGAKEWFLEVRAGNRAAIALYKKSGFVIVGRRPGFYSHPAEDGLVMKKCLEGCAHADIGH